VASTSSLTSSAAGHVGSIRGAGGQGFASWGAALRPSGGLLQRSAAGSAPGWREALAPLPMAGFGAARGFAVQAVVGESALKRYRPVTPGIRHRVTTKRDGLHKGPPVKALSTGKKRIDGRNHHGKVTRRHRGGGHKRKYRFIDFGREVRGEVGEVQRIEYDPNRSSRIALVKYDGLAGRRGEGRDWAGGLRYILATEEMSAGTRVAAGPDAPVKAGCSLPLISIPVGTFVHSLEIVPGRGAKLVRSAGTKAQLIGRADDTYSIVRLPSGEVRRVHSDCYASVGRVGNIHHVNVKLGKAGAKRWLGRKPRVCGVNMNACDHPHGGGKARHGPGRPPVSRYGVLAKGGKTRKPRNPTNTFIITSRRQARRR